MKVGQLGKFIEYNGNMRFTFKIVSVNPTIQEMRYVILTVGPTGNSHWLDREHLAKFPWILNQRTQWIFDTRDKNKEFKRFRYRRKPKTFRLPKGVTIDSMPTQYDMPLGG
jgi:hypothetical protein